MKVSIQGKVVMFIDEDGLTITITTDQLLEILRILKISFRDNGTAVFETLEFTV